MGAFSSANNLICENALWKTDKVVWKSDIVFQESKQAILGEKFDKPGDQEQFKRLDRSALKISEKVLNTLL